MNYHIHITQTAERDMIRAADYIEFILKNPEAAERLLDTAEEKINALSQFPQKFPLADDRVLSSWGIRFTIVNSYLAFYLISETEKRVIVVRFLYAKSNWVSILKTGFSLQ
ncbi:MAG TPA: type II toxin-antitoxin system RelE/ParE family toxin [Candidatus Blautia faecigallinarum]|uniref:Type II toxin-antitoxin system RelE/ParE family toxin n=1 Tax=Candidatus Blautia faecigallinarum TaxID=2838488 RepID=A0A9D2IUP8_9FIRM|nr:type II toxin-antitoxin system RelE/ParE family toxin [Candidatus Blautia faecigallinarum]